MKLLALDMSMRTSGWAIFEDGKLTHKGSIPEPKYKGKSKDRYPKRTAKVGIMMAEELLEVVKFYEPDHIVIEEISLGGRAGIKSIKGLAMMQGALLLLIYMIYGLDHISMVTPSGKGGWRTILGLKKNGDYKASAVKMTNEIFDLGLVYEDHDIADAILLGYSQIVDNS